MTMPILTLQKRARSLGRIRIGQVVPTSNGKTRPEKLDRFRLTSPSKDLLDKAAVLYGGTVQEWTPQGGGAAQWEVLTDSRRIPIMVPPQPVSQFLESWGRGHCTHRCDGYTNFLTGEPCDPDDPLHMDARPTTRLNVVLRDVEGIGVWRLESKGWNAAMELPDSADFLAQAGGYVEGWLSLEERTSVTVVNDKVQTRRFMVPIIEIDVTPAQLMAGQGRVPTPTLEGPVERKALEAGPAATTTNLPTLDDIAGATTHESVANIWRYLKGQDALTPELEAACAARAGVLTLAEASDGDASGPVDSAAVDMNDNPDAVWHEVLAAAGSLPTPMTTSEVVADFEQRYAMAPASATAGELRGYLQVLRTEAAA